MKQKITKNQDFWIDKLSKGYEVWDFYLHVHLHLTNSKIIEKINNKITSKNIDVLLIEGDHLALNDLFFLRSINQKVLKGLFLGDDSEWHQVNLISASIFD